MQFVTNGPDIPEALLQLHEEGRVVFFCGAGISYPAGLPGFKGLVDEIYRLVGTTRLPIENEAYGRGQYDATLDLLERRIPGQRAAVRAALVQALQPKLRRKGATDTHLALLQLSRCRSGALRLITTNFDRVFEHVAKKTRQVSNAYSAPMLPIPKNSRWDGLVYLHGLLPNKPDESALQRLVLTSGDFGLAYLTERWAARFVSELFRNYVVCFVGYSINDPVLRYMMDALAADRMLGEVTPQAYALGDCEPGREPFKTIEWKAKGVTPILYEVPAGSHNHSAMHKTLRAWAETYRDGILGKERIVVEYALGHPSASTRQDDFVGRMLWALSDDSGLPAKLFADFNPVPPLKWLDALSEKRYLHSDLGRFGVSPRTGDDEKLRFSFVHRPAPYRNAPWMMLASGGTVDSQWDEVMFHLARWLVRHMNDPALVIWLTERGGYLHDRWSWLIERELDRFARLANEGKTTELDEIRTNAPNAIPGPVMQTLWRLLLTGRVKWPGRDPDLYRWKDRLRRDGMTTTLRLELRELLSPKIALKQPFRWSSVDENTVEPKKIKQLVDWELVLVADDVHTALRDIADARWHAAMPTLLADFQYLLRDALDLLCEMGEADELNDRSHWDLPSISPHWQNRSFQDWVILIELLRDSWLANFESEPNHAIRIAQDWFELPYAAFKRLALYAASQNGCIDPSQWVDWLTVGDGWWLWSVDTRRETMRLLVLQSKNLPLEARAKLESAILKGPPRHMYHDDIEPDAWHRERDHLVWLHLAKLWEGGRQIGVAASQRLNDLSLANPAWKLADNERDEFSHWMSGTGDPDYIKNRNVDLAPRKREELVVWLRQPTSERNPFYEDTWRETCRTRFFHSFSALCDLAQEGCWPAGRWREALQAWSEEGRITRSWHFAAALVRTMPDDTLREIVNAVTWWVEAASKSPGRHEAVLSELCGRILRLPPEAASSITQNGESSRDPITEAINHPVGHVTQALLNLWFRRQPNDNERLPVEIEPYFTQLCDTQVGRFRHGRVLLASRLISLFRVDPIWSKKNLVPLFDWASDSMEARSVWDGFLWSPRLYLPLLIELKMHFLNTVHHYAELGEHGRQFAAFLTYAALAAVDGYTPADFQMAIGALPQEALQEVARALAQALEGAGEQREDYWKNRVQPFWQAIWPKSGDLTSNNIVESLARLSIAARGEFPAALSAVSGWLHSIEHPHYVVQLLHESGLARRFPSDALRFLSIVIDNQPWAPRELEKCVEAIVDAAPNLSQDHRYLRLAEYVRRHRP